LLKTTRGLGVHERVSSGLPNYMYFTDSWPHCREQCVRLAGVLRFQILALFPWFRALDRSTLVPWY